ncbi:MAG: ArsR family transcriptional regulator, partial [Paraglaciecola sp.]
QERIQLFQRCDTFLHSPQIASAVIHIQSLRDYCLTSSLIQKTSKMGATKTTAFSDQQNQLAAFAKALGHPARIAILQHLLTVKGCVCGDIVEILPLSQSTVSQHLKALKTAGIIKGEIEGVKTCYCINEVVWQQAGAFLGQFFEQKHCC